MSIGEDTRKGKSEPRAPPTEESEEEAIEKLLEHCTDVTQEEKEIFIMLRKEAEKLNKIILEQIRFKEGNEHLCKICGTFFENGRQLGGHMSRRHPGKSMEYGVKRQAQRTKLVERKRRNYFKLKNMAKNHH